MKSLESQNHNQVLQQSIQLLLNTVQVRLMSKMIQEFNTYNQYTKMFLVHNSY